MQPGPGPQSTPSLLGLGHYSYLISILGNTYLLTDLLDNYMKFGRCYGLDCGHHTDKDYTEIPFDEFDGIRNDNRYYWDSLIGHYRNFASVIPGINSEYCKKCNQMRRVLRVNIFVDNILDSGAGIKV